MCDGRYRRLIFVGQLESNFLPIYLYFQFFFKQYISSKILVVDTEKKLDTVIILKTPAVLTIDKDLIRP